MTNAEQRSDCEGPVDIVGQARLGAGIKGFTEEPAFVILHMIGLTGKGDLKLTQYSKAFWDGSEQPVRQPISLKQAATVMNVMMADIRAGALKPDKLDDFDALVWTNLSYVGFIATNDAWAFRGSDGSGEAAVVFEINTHSFFDGSHAKIGGQPAYVFINHMKDKQANDLGPHPDPFKYSMFFRVPVVTRPRSSPPRKLTLIIDPGGANMGPRGRP